MRLEGVIGRHSETPMRKLNAYCRYHTLNKKKVGQYVRQKQNKERKMV